MVGKKMSMLKFVGELEKFDDIRQYSEYFVRTKRIKNVNYII